MHWHFSFLEMDIDACFKVGFVLKTHGLKGEVTVSLDGYNAPDELGTMQSMFLEKNKRLVPFFIESISVRGTKAFVKFEDVNSIEDASKLVGQSIYLQKSERPKARRGEFYDDEVIGFSVTDQEVGPLGNIVEIIQAGLNKLLVLDYSGKEILIPVNSPFIVQVNKSKKTLTVNLPDGFLDI